MINKVSFCIATNGKKEVLTTTCIGSIAKACINANLAFEIIVCGITDPFKNLSNILKFIKCVDHPKEANNGELAKLRNLAAEHTDGDILVFIDDDIIFHDDWAISLINYSSNHSWDILGNRILMPNYDRYWDRAVMRKNLLHHMVPYDYPDSDPELYQTGCFWIVSRSLFNNYKWDSDIGYYAAHHGGTNEDIEYSQRLASHGYKFMFNVNGLVWHWDEYYREIKYPDGISVCEKFKNPEPMLYSHEFLSLLTRLGVEYTTNQTA
jgi:glycosyltransferase involved in cell wall biosynthesis